MLKFSWTYPMRSPSCWVLCVSTSSAEPLTTSHLLLHKGSRNTGHLLHFAFLVYWYIHSTPLCRDLSHSSSQAAWHSAVWLYLTTFRHLDCFQNFSTINNHLLCMYFHIVGIKIYIVCKVYIF